MKKTYIAPKMRTFKISHRNLLISGSGGGVSLPNGGVSSGGISADSREFDWDDEDF